MAEKQKPFEKIFPYISYRYKYDDGEFSPYAPFTEVQFVSKKQDTTVLNDRYEKGFNVSMVNDLENIVINDVPKGREDVVSIDILYTESISSTVYILKTIEIDPAERGQGTLDGIIISKRAFGAALPDTELTRQFDSVPRSAKSQEFTANRIMYGNYLSKYNQNKNDLGGKGFEMAVSLSGQLDPVSGPSVKTNRTYDIGVSYLDKYGRQGGLLTQTTGKNTDNTSLIKTAFCYESRIKLAAQIISGPPKWAKYYKYYIKDVSTDFFNLTAFNTYLDGEPGDTETANVYLQFDSKDRNKLTEDSFLMPRRDGMSGTDSRGVVIEELSRLPVLGIENEAPDIVKAQVLERTASPLATFIDGNARIVNKNATNASTGNNDETTAVNQTSLVIHDESKREGFVPIISALNNYIRSQDTSPSTIFGQAINDTSSSGQTVDVSGFADRLCLRIKPQKESDDSTFKTDLVLVDTVEFIRINGEKNRNAFKFTLSNRIDESGLIEANTGLSKGGVNMQGTGPLANLKLYKLGLSEVGANKLKGSFFVKVPRKTGIVSFSTLPIEQTQLNEDGKAEKINFLDFETEPGDDSNLNLYWESGKVFSVTEDHGNTNVIPWSNCIATLGGTNNKVYLESVKIQDKFNSTSMVKGIRVNTPEPNYGEERRKNGLIFSGLYNSRTGINELNRFNLTDGITKDLEPNYGGIQKLFALDTNLLAFCEDKVFKILADKDALFNADDGVNVTATNLVLGQAMGFGGNYGISTHPESFAYFNNNIFFTDAKRGAVMQLTPSNGQLFPISRNGMSNFFRDRLGALNASNKIIGIYNGYKKMYILSIQGYNPSHASIGTESLPSETTELTTGYSLASQGWTSRYSYIPETGVTLNNKFYTFKNGKVYLHNSNTANRNNFYGTGYNSEVQVIFNDNPTVISDWLSLNYEGGEGWEAVEIIGDQDGTYNITNVRLLDSEESGFLGWFFKEGKYHGAIVGTQPLYAIQAGQSDSLTDFVLQATGTTEDISGTKGFFQKTRLRNSSTTAKELFAVSSEYYISQT
ncbi:MAG: putative structural protein [Prokaryotic dsDNA virus sp.]|nr:MAG: putative structural protein [Prokaryotic dsDNA virus sp.]|tara:strand:- start:12482 stop:15598 length:3117 start_codon:yes stop_codon:yes gene_type:complete